MHSPNQKIRASFLKENKVSLSIKREDLLHPLISGNKFRKLKYNLLEARKERHETLLTFGGAFSNHIVATAAAAKENGFKSIGVIRGGELHDRWYDNPSLQLASEQGMQFYFVSREAYRRKHSDSFVDGLKQRFGEFYMLPEGGTNGLAIKGCEEILAEGDRDATVICCAVGTGGTISGLINASHPHQKVLGFPALKGDFLRAEIKKNVKKENWGLVQDYHFGGYAKVNAELVGFVNSFKEAFHVPLDPVYTGKMLFGLFDLIKKGYFRPQTHILAIHTGGLQGIEGMNNVLKSKNLPLLNT